MDWKMHSYCRPVNTEDEEVVYCICRSKDTNRFMICCDKCNEWYHGDCIDLTEKRAKLIATYYCAKCTEKEPALHIQFKPKKEKLHKSSETAGASKERKRGARKSTRRCGECIACYRTEDCGRCDFCKDMKKFGGPNKIRQKCRQRQCINFGLVIGRTKHSFPDRVSVEMSDSESKDTSRGVLKDITRSQDSDEDDSDDGGSSTCEPKRKRGRPKGSSKKSQKLKDKGRKGNLSKRRHRHKKRRRRRRHKYSQDGSDRERRDGRHWRGRSDEKKQCYGPGCQQAARPSSKYCSDDCGVKLAVSRIFNILPQRIQQWNSSQCAAEENSKRQLEAIREKQLKAQKVLATLDLKSQRLEAFIARAKQTTLAAEQENNEGEDETELSVYCVTCGMEIAARTALRHMEKCFNKYESQTSFGSAYKTRIEGSNNVFCDTYNAQQGTYCKRLRVLCPEHSKEPKIPDNEVCGCPLVANVFEETGEFCRITRKKCMKHYCWEKLRRAEIDMDRVRQWLTLDDLLEQERGIRLAMANRAGVLGLMLHSSVNHDAAVPMMGSVEPLAPPALGNN